MSSFTIRKDLIDAFEARWIQIQTAWTPATQTSKPPKKFKPTTNQWIQLVCTNQGGRNRAVGILDEVTNLFTVDVYNRLRGDATLYGVDTLSDDAHNTLRSMTMPAGVDDVEIQPRDFPVTDAGYEHKRLSLFFRFDLPRVK